MKRFELSGCEYGDIIAGEKWLLAARKAAIQEREAWLAQKSELGRYAKDQASEALKEYRGLCLVIGWVLNPDMGDCPAIPPSQWPQELHRYAANAINGAIVSAAPL